jgi:ribosome biogenesis GTPase / thiamine phosphate phosphatase
MTKKSPEPQATDTPLTHFLLPGFFRDRYDKKTLQAPFAGAALARIVEQHRAHVVVALSATELLHAQTHPRLKRGEGKVAVGDFVWYCTKSLVVEQVLPRLSVLKRAAAGERYAEQLLAANIDCAILVCGLDRDYSPRRIERYLTLIQSSGIKATVILSKADSHPAPDEVVSELRARLKTDAVFALDNRSSTDALRIRDILKTGETGVLLGSSGAGKSTLSNTLADMLVMATGEVREADGRGRHTTVHRALLKLPWGAFLIDSPGLREIKLTGGEDLDADSFQDIAELATQCKFRDCHHDQEPGCAVWAAIEADTLDEDRLGSYNKLSAERNSARSRATGGYSSFKQPPMRR